MINNKILLTLLTTAYALEAQANMGRVLMQPAQIITKQAIDATARTRKIKQGMLAGSLVCAGLYALSQTKYGQQKLKEVKAWKRRIAGNASDDTITLADVKGALPREIQRFVEQVRNPKKYAQIHKNKTINYPKGLLLYGPPGTGKTYIARAIAGTLGVPFIEVKTTDIKLSGYGQAEAAIKQKFDEARRAARNAKTKVAILFFDEIDALGEARTNSFIAHKVNIVETLLPLIDGFEQHDVKVIVIGATNKRTMVDEALLRPGRLYPHVKIDLLDAGGTVEVLDYYIKKYDYEFEARPQSYKDLLVDIATMLVAAKKSTPVVIQQLVDQAVKESTHHGFKYLADADIRQQAQKICQEHDADASEVCSMLDATTVADVCGGLPRDIQAVVDKFNNLELYKGIRKDGKVSFPRGFILHGLPGTGKTHIVRAIVGSLGVSCFNMTISDIKKYEYGGSERRIREIFAAARDAAERHPKKLAIVFIDEIDALGGARNDMPIAHKVNLVQSLLTEIDGFKQAAGNVLVIGATNRLDSVDEALRRPDRLYPHIEIKPLDKKGCIEVLGYYLGKYNYEHETHEKECMAMLEALAEMAVRSRKIVPTPSVMKHIIETASNTAVEQRLQVIPDKILLDVAYKVL